MRKENGFWADSKELPRKYSAEDFMRYFSDLFTDGVLGDDVSKLQVIADNGMTLTITSGTAYLDGRFFAPTAAKTVTLSASDTAYDRIDLVCIRADYAKKTIYIHVKEGIPASSPDIPTVTRDGNYFDLGIAAVAVNADVTEISQADITDLRFDNAYCGQVTSIIKTIDTTTLFAQYEAQWQLLKAACENDAEGVIKAWESLNAVKSVCNVEPVDGNIPLTMDDIGEGNSYGKYLIQSGSFTMTSGNSTTVTFPKAYSSAPIVFGIYHPKDTDDNSNYRVGYCHPVTTTKTSVVLTYYRGSSSAAPSSSYPCTYTWVAIGQP